MAGYQGGADAAVIQAARSAYAIPKGYHASVWDYKEYIEGIAGLAKFVVGKVGAANERMSTIAGIEEGINTEFWNANNTEYFTDLKARMAEASRKMKMGLPFTKEYKENERIWSDGMASLKKIKDDETTLEEIVKTIKSATGAERSLWNDPMVASLMAEIQGDSGMFDQSVRFTDDGIMVVDPSGEYREIPLSELAMPAVKTDGRTTHDTVTAQVQGAIGVKQGGGWNDWNRSVVKQNISSFLDTETRNGLGSAAFDYEFLTKDGSMSFADYLVKTSGKLQEDYEKWEAEHPGEYSTDEIKNMKSYLAKNLWHNDSQMKDEYLNWVMEEVVDFHVGNTSVKGDDDFDYDYDDDGDEGEDSPFMSWLKDTMKKNKVTNDNDLDGIPNYLDPHPNTPYKK